MLGGVLAGLAIGLVLVVLGAHWWLNRYLHGEAFRKLISVKTAAALRGEGEYLPLHWTGTTAYSDGFHARGVSGSPLKELRADQIRAEFEVSGLLRNTWRVSGLDIQRLTATLGTAAAEGARSASLQAASHSSVRLELEPLRIHDANIEWTLGGSASGAVRRAQMVVKFGGGFWEASASSGELRFTDVQPVRIEQAYVRFQRDAAFVSDSLLHLADGGKVTVNGQIGLGPAGESDLTLRYDEVPVDRWLPKTGAAGSSARCAAKARCADVLASRTR